MKQFSLRQALSVVCISCIILAVAVFFTFTGCKRSNPDISDPGVTPNLALVADNIASPLGLVESPDGTGRLFIIDQTGKIWIVKDGVKLDVPFLDLYGKIVALTPQYDERGLLGLAFHPQFKNNGKFYVFYTALPHPGGPIPGKNWSSLTRISEFTATLGANTADANSERILLEADHPQSNHNGGTIAFGKDGYLYISIGDGGGKDDDDSSGHVEDWYAVNKGGNAQNIYANLMGKILRIDVNGSPYNIPGDNPFTSIAGAKAEIYAFGFRNPYRFSFDMGGGNALIEGDAGQSLYEEVNLVDKGGNYGWNVKEGTVCFNTDNDLTTRDNCPMQDTNGRLLINPVIQLKNTANPAGGGIATTIIGGNVYRGKAIQQLFGRYIFGVFSEKPGSPDAKLYMADMNGNSEWKYEELKLKDYTNNLGMYLKGFGQDMAGEVYITTSMNAGVAGTTGKVFKIVGVKNN